MGKVFGDLCPPTCFLDPWPLWLVRASWEGVKPHGPAAINKALQLGEMMLPLKEAAVWAVLKSPPWILLIWIMDLLQLSSSVWKGKVINMLVPPYVIFQYPLIWELIKRSQNYRAGRDPEGPLACPCNAGITATNVWGYGHHLSGPALPERVARQPWVAS